MLSKIDYETYKADRRSDRLYKKASILKRAVVLSYASMVLTNESFNLIKYDSKYSIVEYLEELGFLSDMVSTYY